ncbi:hypothetical protein KM043_000108 [Ampulex compressa]|nr:hypothetical protein KM043_000108 [Ampulex compressa]
MTQKCALEQQVLVKAFALASTAPEEVALTLMKASGYMAVTAGEVMHIIKRIPVNCQIRRTEDCYTELPVTHNNISLFLLPRSKLLVRKGTLRECNLVLPVMYHLKQARYKVEPRFTETLPPGKIQPSPKPTWRYRIPSSLTTSRIYTEEDLSKLRAHIMFPAKKQPSSILWHRQPWVSKFQQEVLTCINCCTKLSSNR